MEGFIYVHRLQFSQVMSSISHQSQRRFRLEGRFAGFVPLKKKHPFKYLRLMTATGEYCIKLPKHLQIEIVSRFTPGNWIQVSGECKEKSGGDLRFKADSLIQANPSSSTLGCTAQSPVEQPENSEVLPPCAQAAQTKQSKVKVLVCGKSKCMKQGGRAVCQKLENLVDNQGLTDQVTIKKTGCMDRCKAGPNMVVMPDKTRYSKVKPDSVPDLLERHLKA